VTGLPSLAAASGASALGPHDIGFLGRGNAWVTIGFGNEPALRANLGSVGSQFARLLRLLPNGRVEFAENLGNYETDENPDGGAHDTNPFGIAVLPSRTLYTDAGGNALNQVDRNGSISTLAVFPDRQVPSPLPPPAPAIATIQGVPTSVVEGPDGWLYVGQLTGFPFPVGAANVYRIPPEGGIPEVFASGFTNIIDIAFGPDGSLYVLEIDTNSLRVTGADGALIKVAPNGTKTTIASVGLTTPGGVAFADDGRIYVTLFSTSPTLGQVVRVNP
jgi:sugar lactone lactonase YvrE